MPAIDISNFKQKKKALDTNTGSTVLDFMNKDFSFGNGQLPDKKKEVFYHELGTLINSGIDLKTALALTASSFTHAKDIALFETIQKEVIAGKSFSETLKHHQKFSEYEYFSIRIGEETGKLAAVLNEQDQAEEKNNWCINLSDIGIEYFTWCYIFYDQICGAHVC
jgi:type IV pilus assembly protein PilC